MFPGGGGAVTTIYAGTEYVIFLGCRFRVENNFGVSFLVISQVVINFGVSF